jgi:hypothetical protein
VVIVVILVVVLLVVHLQLAHGEVWCGLGGRTDPCEYGEQVRVRFAAENYCRASALGVAVPR